ncbi:MAG: MATE family efflux transporter [Blautia sp.]|nr:MATE family efflux transporter [Blautia sp.]
MTKDLTKGKVLPLLIRFTVPMVLGNVFQMTYNAVDSIIAGRYVGKEALAAIGICGPVTTLFILFLNGLCLGASVLMGTHYGAGDMKLLRRQVSTTMLAGVFFSLSLSVICVLLAEPILALLHVDEGIFTLTRAYFRIILCGMVFTFFYNFFSSTLRALGDAVTPLLFLMVSAVLNVLGDLFFVIVCRLGAHGCGIATVISEALSVVFCVFYIRKKVPMLNLGKEWLIFDRGMLKQTVAYGWISAMQQSTVQLGKICVQGIVNTLGISITAAFTAVTRVDDFTMTPTQNIGHSMTALMAQNHGAGNKKRMKEGFRAGMLLEITYGFLLFLLCFFFAGPIMRLFTKDEEVILHGIKYLRLIAPMYLLPSLTNGIQGYFRGIGDLKITLFSSMVNMGLRVAFAALLVFGFHFGIEALPWSYFAGWAGMLTAEVPLLIRNYRRG